MAVGGVRGHRTVDDHSIVDGARRIWTCSFCGRRGRWTASWSWRGVLECRDCGAAEINLVACSAACAAEVA